MSEAFGSDQSGAVGLAQAGADVLIAERGQEYLQELLSKTQTPNVDVPMFQKRAGLPEAECKPLLQLADKLKLRRADSHKAVYDGAKAMLLQRLPLLSTDALLRLLDASFAYIEVKDLQDIPLKVLERLHPVPVAYLKTLAGHGDLFLKLPYSVQRQVWEMDRKLLQQHMLPLINGCAYESCTLSSLLDMDDTLPLTRTFRRAGMQPPSRRMQRESSSLLQKLVSMVGHSRQVYKGCMELIVARFADTIDSSSPHITLKDAGYCLLRSQLLMALHDQGANELCAAERVHKLAWTLDAAHKDRAIDERRLKELSEFFHPFDSAHDHGRRLSSGRGARYQQEGDADSAAWSGVPQTGVDDPQLALGHAAACLRDPPVLFLLAHAALRCLLACVNREQLPRDDASLVLLTRMLQLGVSAKRVMRDKQTYFSPVSQKLMEETYPILANHVVLSQLRALGQRDNVPDIDGLQSYLTDACWREESGRTSDSVLVTQLLTQTLALERAAAADLKGLQMLLEALAQVPEKWLKNAAQAAAFAWSLAGRLQPMVDAGRLGPGNPLWPLVFDRVLVKCVDFDPQLHLRVLTMLRSVAGRLTREQLGQYLQDTLYNSRKSRKRSRKQAKRATGEFESVASFHSISSAVTSGLSKSLGLVDLEGEHVAAGQQALRAMYEEFRSEYSLDDSNASSLITYLNQV